MTTAGFELLHPALQYHVVNSLGWAALRPTQDEAIAHVIAGSDCLILAPTAGGKTEAAIIPVLSRMLSEDWRGLTVLYVCPIKALLNNLEPRLSHYAGLVGRSVGLWHGDVSASVKHRVRREPRSPAHNPGVTRGDSNLPTKRQGGAPRRTPDVDCRRAARLCGG